MRLLQCSDEWIVNNAKLWFPIVNKYDKNDVEWIMNDITGRLNPQLADDLDCI